MIKNKIINDAAILYYKENVEGEPLDKDTPIECFIAGAEFIINSQKKRNNCNILKEISFNQEKNIEMDRRIVEAIDKIIEVSGFYVTAPGDPSVGIPSSTWEIKNHFYFDDEEELNNFKNELKSTFEWYCGEIISILTFEEHKMLIDTEKKII